MSWRVDIIEHREVHGRIYAYERPRPLIYESEDLARYEAARLSALTLPPGVVARTVEVVPA